MSQTIEGTVKALTEFEAELDRVKGETMEAKKRMVKDAGDWADSAKSSAIAEAQRLASQRLSEARREAEAEAADTRERGRAETKKFAESISKHKKEATELVLQRLLGEGQ